MAAAPTTHTHDNMASRRAPLAAVPHAVNSPFCSVTAVGGKRTRAQVGDQREAIYGQPPTKKQAIESIEPDNENVDPRGRSGVTVAASEKLDEPFAKRSNHAPTAFEKKLASVRETRPIPQPNRSQKQHADNLESIRQWQKHYRRQFPQFVFYFDNISDDIRAKSMRQINALSAREEKFFSKAVTHVVTTRAIPPEQTNTSPDDDAKHDSVQSRTVQPSAPTNDYRRTTNLLDANLQRRSQYAAAPQTGLDPRRPQTQSVDVLTRARGLGIKIWALEKLTRVLSTILDTDTADHANDSRGHAAAHRVHSRQTQDVDLEQLLRHEKVNGPADRDMTVATQDMITLKGYYIYVHDMDERTKPVMVRDYSKPTSKEQGKWPQFRLTAAGRCPFVEDPAHTKRLQQQERDTAARMQNEIAYNKPRAGHTLPAPATQQANGREANLRRSPRKLAQVSNASVSRPLDPPPSRRQSSNELAPVFFGSTQANLRGHPRMVGGEPVASGVQRSNVTSAIRSQAVSSAAISSTAPGMNRRVGDTKEVSLLKRKVLASNTSMPSSYMNEVRGAINEPRDPPPRAAKRKAQETLGVLYENDNDGHRSRARTSAPKRAKSVLKELKPGYCENCRDKFEDFDEHVVSRKHRKFAQTAENWAELDSLLFELKRPHKPHM
ncbi:hypothetical protein DOTSEDRAFT_68476 [Dothistroma septosporum NZE10]|uniref:DBF4-type domain-containing protein n=1 Tax=Dothistroma septosporum (strain NZE10 / CBS 128990) TaxID=675120 RepID=N1Q202_DOTSN|nr:hypothetical protein DOTSEDRAFT_68476 [Dothistroma septosporum NZE10]